VIDWIAAQPWSDGRVGMYGGSYNGFAQWAALKHRPRALKAIATSATAAPGIDTPMEGGIFLNFMYPWPFYAASNRSLDDARYNDRARWAGLDRAGTPAAAPTATCRRSMAAPTRCSPGGCSTRTTMGTGRR
jgi:predicted acyl esterase